MAPGGYESWFVSARDPASPRALWIRHTRLRSGAGPESVALWCTVVDHAVSPRPVVVKQVFGAFPAVLLWLRCSTSIVGCETLKI